MVRQIDGIFSSPAHAQPRGKNTGQMRSPTIFDKYPIVEADKESPLVPMAESSPEASLGSNKSRTRNDTKAEDAVPSPEKRRTGPVSESQSKREPILLGMPSSMFHSAEDSKLEGKQSEKALEGGRPKTEEGPIAGPEEVVITPGNQGKRSTYQTPREGYPGLNNSTARLPIATSEGNLEKRPGPASTIVSSLHVDGNEPMAGKPHRSVAAGNDFEAQDSKREESEGSGVISSFALERDD